MRITPHASVASLVRSDADRRMRTQRGFLYAWAVPYLAIAVFAALAATFGWLYKGEVDAHAAFVAHVQQQAESVRLANLEEISRLESVGRDSSASWAAALAAARNRPLVRVLPANCRAGGLSATASPAGLVAQSPQWQPGLGAARDVAAEECETRLNAAIIDAAWIEHVKAYTDAQAGVVE